MSLFDFAKDIGNRLFKTDADAAANIKEHLEFSLSGVKDLDVQFDDGVVTLCGDCESPSIRESAILIAGNVQGVAKVVADDLKAPEQKEKIEIYEIQRGDSLSAIAKKYYGDPMKYTEIFEANKEVILDPNKIYPGQKIRIPIQ